MQFTVGRFVLDVGWYPDADPEGAFHCRVIEKGMGTGKECFMTRSAIKVLNWFNVVRIRAEDATAAGTSLTDPNWRAHPEHRNCPHYNKRRRQSRG